MFYKLFRFGLFCLLGLSGAILVIVLASRGSQSVQAQALEANVSGPGATSVSPAQPEPARPLQAPPSEDNPPASSEPNPGVLDTQPLVPAKPSAGPFPTHWYTVLGAVFQPANSGYSYQYGNSGCLKSNSPGYWRASVNLPDGSIAKYLYIDYKNDMYSNNSTAYLTKYKYNGDYADLAAVTSRTYTVTAGTGYFIDLSGEFTQTIDNLQYGYSFIWSGSISQRLCSVKLGYYPPSGFALALPIVTR